jgi:hypothetical protein
MNSYEISFHHSINRESSGSFSTNSNSQGKMVVQAQTNSQAEQMVRSMFGGHNNCEIRTTTQKF